VAFLKTPEPPFVISRKGADGGAIGKVSGKGGKAKTISERETKKQKKRRQDLKPALYSCLREKSRRIWEEKTSKNSDLPEKQLGEKERKKKKHEKRKKVLSEHGPVGNKTRTH